MARPFASRFPRVAALLASTGLTSAAAPAVADEDDEEAEASAPKTVDAAKLQTAFEADAGKMVSDERARWAAVLESDEGQANVVGATTLLSDTDMEAEKVKATLKKMGPAAKVAPKGGAADEGGEGDDDEGADRNGIRGVSGIGKARERLRGSADVDKDTGGGGAGAKGGKGGKDGTGSADAAEAARERREAMQERRNKQAQTGGGRGARDRRQAGAAR